MIPALSTLALNSHERTAQSASALSQTSAFKPVARDQRIDLVRGLALCMIFINHMPGYWLENYTSRNFGFSNAAELFVLLAGFAAAFAYGRHMTSGSPWALTIKAIRRAGVLYTAHLFTTAAAILMFWAFLSTGGSAERYDLIGIEPILADPQANLLALLSGGLQLSYFNILPLYVVLLAALPVIL